MKHSGESVLSTSPGDWPAACNVPETLRPGFMYLHLLPGFPDEIVVSKVTRRPRHVTLLRTGTELPYTFEHNTLRIVVPAAWRTDSPDTVAVSR